MPATSKRIPKSPIHRRICGQIRSKRIAAGLSQEECAELLGVSGPRWNLIETGKHSPRVDLLERIAKKVFKCDVEEFFESESAAV